MCDTSQKFCSCRRPGIEEDHPHWTVRKVDRDQRKETGFLGEKIARRYLEEKGWRIRETNWRTRLGELDIIAEQDGWIIVVEVRTTRSHRYGYGFQSVDRKKQQQVRRLATQYLRQKHLDHHLVRLDVISILLGPTEEAVQVDHFEGAF
ncbi:putative endonuclease [Marininema mesophilum]|uniref:UPF0102 protein SAMN05444487_10147 n=1 Tax=Marininema mesophilum TaxID=1048340 RepID=A0A1H2Q1D4_9BACL|nr:YraN family protein [Marininema mesophilum]SDW00474.1 putative endonuclease [Marininema mesophilum]